MPADDGREWNLLKLMTDAMRTLSTTEALQRCCKSVIGETVNIGGCHSKRDHHSRTTKLRKMSLNRAANAFDLKIFFHNRTPSSKFSTVYRKLLNSGEKAERHDLWRK